MPCTWTAQSVLSSCATPFYLIPGWGTVSSVCTCGGGGFECSQRARARGQRALCPWSSTWCNCSFTHILKIGWPGLFPTRRNTFPLSPWDVRHCCHQSDVFRAIRILCISAATKNGFVKCHHFTSPIPGSVCQTLQTGANEKLHFWSEWRWGEHQTLFTQKPSLLGN